MKPIPNYTDWPAIRSAIQPTTEETIFVDRIIEQMTLEEKVGQMIQPDIRDVTPAEAREYKLGSILNGGGGWVNGDKRASAGDWLGLLDQYWDALEAAYADRPFRIPYLWGTDAVHGHNNIYRATVFPHNIGLGAALDPDLIRRIAEATATEICVTGMDWTFAPTVATPRNLRWGRTYEGYSEDPAIVYHYAGEVVRGLQQSTEALKTDRAVLSNVKHWVGDGGTRHGVDRGCNHYDEEILRNIHAMGYFSGLEAGAQIVMASFSTWEGETNYDHSPDDGVVYNKKITGSRYLITDVLKDKMGFDGLVVSDWNSHAEVSKCSDNNANYAINAGIDILMTTGSSDWRQVYWNAVAAVERGEIPMARIDDAVRRILRVKFRAGMWDKPKPSERALAGKEALLGSPEHRAIAREAVRKSLVLLKNNDILPLSRSKPILVTGSACDDLQKQTGGWTLTWQGSENTREDFPGAKTFADSAREILGTDRCAVDPRLDWANPQDFDTAVLVIGEDPAAEMFGDIAPGHSLALSKIKRKYQADLDLLKRLKQAGVRVVTVLYSGRPLYTNEEINHSDAFVAAWLPGTEADGLTDVLFEPGDGQPRYDFTGRLSFSWPNRPDSDAVNAIPAHIPDYRVPAEEQDPTGEHAPVFPLGYGLSLYGESTRLAIDLDRLPVSSGSSVEADTTVETLELFGKRANGDFNLMLSTLEDSKETPVSSNQTTRRDGVTIVPIDYRHQQDARRVAVESGSAIVRVAAGDSDGYDLSEYATHDVVLAFDIRTDSDWPDGSSVAIDGATGHSTTLAVSNYLPDESLTDWVTVRIPLADFGLEADALRETLSPVRLEIPSACRFDLGDIRWSVSG